jgi:hypothetical protein
MDYGTLVSRAWRLTWRHRFMWVLGLVAASTTGSCSGSPGGGVQWQTDAQEVERTLPELGRALGEVGRWIADNLALVVSIAIFAALLGLAFFVVSLIAQGAMARATEDAARNRRTSLRQAWQAGLRFFWRYLGLWLLLLAIGIAILVVFGVLFLLFVAGSAAAEGAARTTFVVILVLLGLAAFLIALPLVVGLTIVVAYAQRAIVVEDVGPWDALGVGVRLVRDRLGPSLLVWLISLALGIGAAFALGLAAVLLIIPLGGVGALLFLTTGISAGSIAYAVVAALVFIGVMWFLAAIVNTYFWHFWTLAYLDLRGYVPVGEVR